MKRLLALLALAGCGEGDLEPRAESASQPPQTAQARALRDVLDARLAALGLSTRGDIGTSRELRDDTGVLPPEARELNPGELNPGELNPGELNSGEMEPGDIEAEASPAEAVVVNSTADGAVPGPSGPTSNGNPEPLDPGLVEFRDGMVETVLSTPGALDRARGDVSAIGAEVVPVLKAGLLDPTREPKELKVLVDLAIAVPHAELALAMAQLAARADDAWLRRYAVWALESQRGAPGADQVVPLLLLRMKYEPDGEALGWLLRTLWGFGNEASVGRARERATSMVDTGSRATLERSLAGYDGLDGPESTSPSAELIAETWHWISDLSGEHFQLRGVDDARYVLSSLGPWAAEIFAEALEDDDAYVRLHLAQVLERMGPRGEPAIGSLVAALTDPSGAVRGAAADALVAIAGAGARAPLTARLDSQPAPPYEDRVALTRALSALPGPVNRQRLRASFDASPGVDLKLAAAGGLLRSGERDVALWLARGLRPGSNDPAGAEATLRRWLEAGEGVAEAGLPAASEALKAWNELGPKGAVIHDRGATMARREARADLIRDWLSQAAPANQ